MNTTHTNEDRMPPDLNAYEAEMAQAKEREHWREINTLAEKTDAVEVAECDPLARRLRGRAAFLRAKGEVKTPELLERAATELEATPAAPVESLEDETKAFEAALARMPDWAPEYEQHRPWVTALMRFMWVDARR